MKLARKLWPVLGLLGVVIAAAVAWAAAPGVINNYVGVCDPNFATRCIAPDSSGNVPVTVGSGTITLGPSQNNIGNVGGKTVSVCVTPTVTASNSYGTNYVVGGLLTFANAFTSTGTGILQGVEVDIKKVETSGFTFIPFISNPSNTTWTDAAAANINAADVFAVRGPVSLSAYSGLGTMTSAYSNGLGEPLAPVATTLYGILLANAALTNQFGSTSDVQVCIKILQDL